MNLEKLIHIIQEQSNKELGNVLIRKIAISIKENYYNLTDDISIKLAHIRNSRFDTPQTIFLEIDGIKYRLYLPKNSLNKVTTKEKTYFEPSEMSIRLAAL